MGIICLIPKINPKANKLKKKQLYFFKIDQVKFKFGVASSENIHSALFIVDSRQIQTNVNLLGGENKD